MSYLPLENLHEKLTASGLPVAGVSQGGPPTVNSWHTLPTPAQLAVAQAICAAYDMSPRVLRPLAGIEASISALSAADKTLLVDAVQAYLNARGEFGTQLAKGIIGALGLNPIQSRLVRLSLAAALLLINPSFCDGLGMAAPVLGDEPAPT